MFFVYILYNSTIDKYYVGYTSDISKRIADHNSSKHKTKFTRKQKGSWNLAYSESFESRSDAILREKKIKSWKSSIRIRMVRGSLPGDRQGVPPSHILSVSLRTDTKCRVHKATNGKL